jgi:GAF domain-containing protein
VGADATFFDNPELPDTRTEIALPLVARGQIIGALDIQSTQENAFDETDVAGLSALADQIAVALDNARLYEMSQTALAQMEAAQRQYTAGKWQEYRSQTASDLFEYRRSAAVPVAEGTRPTDADAATEDATATGERDNGKSASMVAPIKLRGTVIGELGLEGSASRAGETWSEEDVALIETIADQVGQAIEAARLFDETERRARREHMVTEIAGKIRSAPDMEGILRTAVQEIRRTLGASHGVIRLGTESHLRPPRIEGDTQDSRHIKQDEQPGLQGDHQDE